MIYMSFSCGCLWTTSLNDKHSCQLFRMGLRNKTTPTLTTPLVRAELCGSYHLLQSWFSFFVHLHGQPKPFGSCNILQSCSSFFFWAVRYRPPSPVLGFSPTHCRHLASIFWECPGVVSCFFLFSYVRVLSSAFLSSILQSLKLCLL